MKKSMITHKSISFGIILFISLAVSATVFIPPAWCADQLKARLSYHWFPKHQGSPRPSGGSDRGLPGPCAADRG